MREIGLIRWFGGYNVKQKRMNDFGFITNDKNEDIYFNKGHVQCKLKELTAGTAVTFEKGINYKNNRDQCIRVKLLKDEKDIELFYKFLNSDICSQLNLKDKSDILLNIEEKDVVRFWNEYSEELKIMFLYRLCMENRKFNLIENINEENEFIRAMLLLYWGKINECSNEIIVTKVLNLIKTYLNTSSESVNLVDNCKEEQRDFSIIDFVNCCTSKLDKKNRELEELLSVLQIKSA
ncbi:MULTISPECIES: hypothetical protein [Clostridium]|uniref:hypothetical protein n=1 Tax=Clostridium TaxID=1485 RepID=UPI000825E551|nr:MULTISPECIES: hypothetical protein [Clostridium]PJI09648.1 hypothetical protein CUB90_18025 [Clostridium sp. CT7]